MQLPIELSHPCYHDEDAARVQLESIRWPDGPYCPICGSFDRVKPYGGKAMGPGWYWCTPCRRKFTVRVGSIFERSHIPIHKWLLGFRLMAGSKKGFSAHCAVKSIIASICADRARAFRRYTEQPHPGEHRRCDLLSGIGPDHSLHHTINRTRAAAALPSVIGAGSTGESAL